MAVPLPVCRGTVWSCVRCGEGKDSTTDGTTQYCCKWVSNLINFQHCLVSEHWLFFDHLHLTFLLYHQLVLRLSLTLILNNLESYVLGCMEWQDCCLSYLALTSNRPAGLYCRDKKTLPSLFVKWYSVNMTPLPKLWYTSIYHLDKVHLVLFGDSMLATTPYNQESITVSCNYLYLYGSPTQSILLVLTAAACLNWGYLYMKLRCN